MLDLIDLPYQQKRILKHYCETDHLAFTRTFFKERDGRKFRRGRHHPVVARALERVISGEIKRLIINIPPGYTKTELATIFLMARGMAINPSSRFLHISYSDKLALLNSAMCRNVLKLPEYQALWPMEFSNDANSKHLWRTNKGGQVYAVTSEGQVTGFRAGQMQDEDDSDYVFAGAMLIDDPQKPDIMRFKGQMDNINERYNTTFASRLAEDDPVVVIMQRIAEDDFSGYLLKGGSGEKWHHLNLPVLIENGKEYPKKYTHGIPIPHGLEDGPLWTAKHDLEKIEILKSHPFTYYAQYMQDPRAIEGGIYKAEHFTNNFYEPDDTRVFTYIAIYGDTAQKAKESSDYSVFQAWGLHEDGNIYLLDQIRGKWEAPTLRQMARSFVAKYHNPFATYSRLRSLNVEDAVSGTGLIQDLEKELPIPVLPLTPDRDKYTRALDCTPYLAAGRVKFPNPIAPGYSWVVDFMQEHLAFQADDSHDFDDQIDPHNYAIDDMLRGQVVAGVW